MNIDIEIQNLLSRLMELRGVKQPVKYHPEVDALQHSLQVFFLALKKTKDKDLIIASLFHDIGKSISLKNHSAIGVGILSSYEIITSKTIWLVENHYRIALYLDGAMKNKSKISKLVNNEYFPLLLQLREFDLAGRECEKVIDFDRELITTILVNLFT
ncbi:MAG: HD domain-containing protein [Deltaproteobacteria bacterium]|nr:HD domain-containing protein [Deltaproteobacteria bacterium]